jgi:hypothetical protein
MVQDAPNGAGSRGFKMVQDAPNGAGSRGFKMVQDAPNGAGSRWFKRAKARFKRVQGVQVIFKYG